MADEIVKPPRASSPSPRGTPAPRITVPTAPVSLVHAASNVFNLTYDEQERALSTSSPISLQTLPAQSPISPTDSTNRPSTPLLPSSRGKPFLDVPGLDSR